MPGMTEPSMSSDQSLGLSPLGVMAPIVLSASVPTKIMPPRGPRRVLCVVVVVKWA